MTNEFIDIVSDYEYILGHFQGNVLNLQAQFGEMGWLREELYIIAKELENTGKLFAERQGLRETGTLISSTHAKVDDNQHINFFNNANLGNGFYAGHIEYGHHTKNGGFVPARPFMRPALYAVAEASKGELRGALSRYLNQIVYGKGTLTTLEFGRMNPSPGYTRAFYNQQTLGRGASSNTGHYTAGGLTNASMNKQGAFGKMAATGHRGVMSPVVTERNSLGRAVNAENAHRFMTNTSTGNRHSTASTRTYHYTGKNPGRIGRHSEGKARVKSSRGRGRRAVYSSSKEWPSRQPTGNPRGRPAHYASPKDWPSRKPTGNPRGRPKKYASPKDWPSRRPTGNKPGRPKKGESRANSKKGNKAVQRIENFGKNMQWDTNTNYLDKYSDRWREKTITSNWAKPKNKPVSKGSSANNEKQEQEQEKNKKGPVQQKTVLDKFGLDWRNS